MCEASKTLKLCTCRDNIDKTQPHWTLARKTIKQPTVETVTMGSYTPPELHADTDFTKTQSWIVNQLNTQHCFDFDYEPFKNDKLVIRLPSGTYELEYSDMAQAWEEIDSDDPFLEKVKRSVQARGYVEFNMNRFFL